MKCTIEPLVFGSADRRVKIELGSTEEKRDVTKIIGILGKALRRRRKKGADEIEDVRLPGKRHADLLQVHLGSLLAVTNLESITVSDGGKCPTLRLELRREAA